jgi:hypothetical protein
MIEPFLSVTRVENGFWGGRGKRKLRRRNRDAGRETIVNVMMRMFFRRAIGGGSIKFWQERVKMEEGLTLNALIVWAGATKNWCR